MTATSAPRPFWLAGQPVLSADSFEVTRPYDGGSLGRVSVPSPAQVDKAVAAASAVAADLAALPAYVRAEALTHVSARIKERSEEIAQLITAENGKPLKWSRAEVGRAVSTFRWAAEEARRDSGALQRLDTDPAGTGRLALVRRFPRGPVLGISPFNFPLNLVAHKAAPSLAVGAPIIVKPAPATPLTALLLGELLAETDLPAGAFSVLPVPNDQMDALVQDPRLPVISFTGSGPVGWALKQRVPGKHVVLELGGNAAVLVCADWKDLDWAAQRIATFSNYQAGQSCIAVQRVYVDKKIFDPMTARVRAAVEALHTGDPTDEKTDVGPMISEDAARRVETWVDEAVEMGARVLTGGVRNGNTYPPTVLADVPDGAKVLDEEVFGPVLALAPVESVDDGIAKVNASRYGLQAGIFTLDTATAFRAHRDLLVGGVIVGDVPSYRADQMPYGGVKESGTGREGLRAAMDDLTEARVMVLTGLPL
jgi:acyl-CoA reductase-like NAD-dependent aldehyde dehydrogenase